MAEAQVDNAIADEILAAKYEWDNCGVAYARYSSHSQTEQSIEGQLRDIFDYAKRERIKIINIYVDRAFSGKYDDRPDFQKMITDSHKHQFKYVLVWKFDRFARNKYDSVMYKHKLKQQGVKVISALERLSDNPESVFLESMLEANAEYYSLELSAKILRGNRESKNKGLYTGGGVPYGYKVENRRVVIDEQKAPVVEFIFKEYAAGRPRQHIINELNKKGLTAANGKPFGHSAFARFFTNEKYIGKYEYKGNELNGYYPKMIDESLFYAAKDRAEKNKHATSPAKDKVEYLMSGKLYCGHCGAPMVGDASTSKTGERHYYYSCGNRKQRRACDKKRERKGFVEWYIVEQTVLYVLNDRRINYIADRIVKDYEKEFGNGALQELERKVRITEEQINKATDALINSRSESVRSRLGEKIEQLELTLQDVKIDLAKMRVAANIKYTKEEIIAWIKLFTKGDPLDDDFKKRIIEVFVNSVYLYDDRFVIFYNIKGSRQISYVDMLDSTADAEAMDGADASCANNEDLRGAKLVARGGTSKAESTEKARKNQGFMRTLQGAEVVTLGGAGESCTRVQSAAAAAFYMLSSFEFP